MEYELEVESAGLGPAEVDDLDLPDCFHGRHVGPITVYLRSGVPITGDIVDPVDTGDPFAYFDDEFIVLLYEFKGDIAAYLAGLRHTRMKTLADLIAFNIQNCDAEMTYIDQSVFEAAEATSGDLSDPVYLAARQLLGAGP